MDRFPSGYPTQAHPGTAAAAQEEIDAEVKGGSDTIASGTAQVVIAHGMSAAPSSVIITGTHSEVADCVVSAVDATNITVDAPANTTADRDIYWLARL